MSINLRTTSILTAGVLSHSVSYNAKFEPNGPIEISHSSCTMTVTVSFGNRFADAMGRSATSVELDNNASLLGLLLLVAGQLEDGSVSLLRDGQLASGTMVAVNDQLAIDPASTTLSDGDEVHILSAISGG
ncbi:MoaD/ThiS family protein [Aeoliella sp.]|uniref:MoaD/ThiS family protein n=1 Tax=Aeoliella sp. TaxID=2795800 RepID=UPI003CCBED5A